MNKPPTVTLAETFRTAEGMRVPVGTQAWFDWLELPATRSFRFDDGIDAYTARKERVKGVDGYWYGYRKIGGRLHKRYIGKSKDLSFTRMIEIGGMLNKPSEPREKLPKRVGNSEGLNELGEARETIRSLQKAASERERDFDRCIEQKLRLEEKIGGLHKEIRKLQRELEMRSQPSTPGRDLPEAATLLNKLKAKRKRSTATLADVEVILEMLSPVK